MKHAQPQGLSRRRVEQLLSKTKANRSAGSRIDILSRQFLGQTYRPSPLIGSVDTPEVFTASLNGFDCVTYIETILALSRSATVADFVKWLRKIRYEQGRIQWNRRNHYMTGWIRNNAREGIIRHMRNGMPAVTKERILDVVPGLAAQRTRLQCIPKSSLRSLKSHLQTGDLIFFASTRKNLDIFHGGIIVRDGKRILMRHASRSRGTVVEQNLDEFLKANRMAGVIVVRPSEEKR
jgi:hypothetical protein